MGDHQRGPAGAVGDVGVETLGVNQGGDDGRVVIGDGPVNWEPVVIVFEGDELGVSLWRWGLDDAERCGPG